MNWSFPSPALSSRCRPRSLRAAGLSWLLALLATWLAAHGTSAAADDAPLQRAVSYLAGQLPLWREENGCYSCHHNGDAARVLYYARDAGYQVAAESLSDTSQWLRAPEQWDRNGGDAEFSDKRLAAIQFSFALIGDDSASERDKQVALSSAAERLAREQAPDGSWPVGSPGSVGSPVTYGTALATLAARRVLVAADATQFRDAVDRAEQWFARQRPQSTYQTAVLLWALRDLDRPANDPLVGAYLERMRQAEAKGGGWAAFAGRAPEPFDTAIAMIGLTAWRDQLPTAELVARGRRFLLKEQLANGSWRETTRPANAVSYAQHISTTAWATWALLLSSP